MKTITFFNNKGGVGKTSLVYHLAWMYRRLGLQVLALDLDPQSNLTSAFLPEERLAEVWEDKQSRLTILGSIRPLLDRMGDVSPPHVEVVDRWPLGPDIGFVPGDLDLSMFEERLAETWPRCLDENQANAEDAFRVTTSFHRVALAAAQQLGAEVVLIDVGPSLGTLNRAALVASDYVVVPLDTDLFSLRGLANLGQTLRTWRQGWETRKKMGAVRGALLPGGEMRPVGYVVHQHAARQGSSVQTRDLWMRRVPTEYRAAFLHEPASIVNLSDDPYCLGSIRHYRSLMPMAQQARKPMFELTPADGAFGGHAAAVQDCRESFRQLAQRIATECGIPLPS